MIFPDVGRAAVAHAAGCGHWLVIGSRFLTLSSGRTLCVLCGLAWCTSAAERRALLGSPATIHGGRPAHAAYDSHTRNGGPASPSGAG